MKITLFPTLDESLELHEILIKRFGGAEGVRDLGLLDSALSRPQSGYYASLSEQAAALLQSLISNHAFIDGNKRMAFALTSIFLEMNGYLLNISDVEEAYQFIIKDIIQDKVDLQTIVKWIEKSLVSK